MNFKLWFENQSNSLPPVVYHVTPDADAILRSGRFIAATELGLDHQVLGGSNTDAVSFTTKPNAESYQEGLEIYRHAALGAYHWKDVDMMYSIASRYGLPWRVFDEIRKEIDTWMARSRETDDAHILSEFLAKISYYSFIHSRKSGTDFLPLVIRQGSPFPARLKTSKGIAILAIGTAPGHGKPGPQKVRFVPTEQEWKIFDVENFDYTTLQVVSRGL